MIHTPVQLVAVIHHKLACQPPLNLTRRRRCAGSGVIGRQTESSMAVFSIVTSLFADAVTKRRFLLFVVVCFVKMVSKVSLFQFHNKNTEFL